MKITKSQLKQIIKEELEVTLTNEEATEMFGETVGTQNPRWHLGSRPARPPTMRRCPGRPA